jgi:hypothetical protein
MKTVTYTTWQIETILESLEDSLKVTEDAKIVNEHGYPYCYGYLSATVSNVIFELKELLSRASQNEI